ncbi:hypothetical protein [Nonomuraea jiangxiensis]|nr:hypothetical protein [Nonomuraea jiangxiensis]
MAAPASVKLVFGAVVVLTVSAGVFVVVVEVALVVSGVFLLVSGPS